jgi:hypothetical protein
MYATKAERIRELNELLDELFTPSPKSGKEAKVK